MLKYLKICFTGHRPKGLPWGYNEASESCIRFKNVMYDILKKAIINGYNYFISGMAIGIDMICAEIILKLKEDFPDVVLECAIPCKHQERFWPQRQQARYHSILKKADLIHFVSEDEYLDDCMNNRNRYMVEQADVVIAVWNGKPSGTKNTIKMAKELGKKVRVVNPSIFE